MQTNALSEVLTKSPRPRGAAMAGILYAVSGLGLGCVSGNADVEDEVDTVAPQARLALITALQPGLKVSRCEALKRAQAWVDQGVLYSSTAHYYDATTGIGPYRTDCSGYVSAIWGLAAPGLDTTAFASSSSFQEIAGSNLKPGDALVSTGHIVLYASGQLSSGAIEIYDESQTGYPARRRTRTDIGSSYKPIRYVNITEDSEICNGIDDNCDGQIDEGNVCVVKIAYNGTLLNVQGQMLEQGTTFVPLRGLAEATGHTVGWSSGVTTIDGRVYPQDQIVIRGSVSWTKVRDLAAFLNQSVSWNAATWTVNLSSVSSIVGFVRPDFWVSGNPTSLLAGFRVQADGTAISATTDAAGGFQLALPSGRYDIVVSKPGYLTRRVQQFATGGASLGTAAKPLDIWVGDFVADGAINMADIMDVAKYFNSVKGDGTYVESRDVNADTAINMSDIMLISRHMNTISTDYPAYTP